MLAVGESLDNCEKFFDELIVLTREYISFSLLDVNGIVFLISGFCYFSFHPFILAYFHIHISYKKQTIMNNNSNYK